jgi:hypothetical protein
MNDGSTSCQEFGPLVGWRPINYQGGRLLWSDNKGSVLLWMFGADGELSYVEHGPCDGWVPLYYSGGKILWHGGNGHISLWNVDNSGHQRGYKEHGPLRGCSGISFSYKKRAGAKEFPEKLCWGAGFDANGPLQVHWNK